MANYTIVDFVRNSPEHFASILFFKNLIENHTDPNQYITSIPGGAGGVQHPIISHGEDGGENGLLGEGLTPLSRLVVTGHHIDDISGLQYMTLLQILDLSRNRIIRASLAGSVFPASLQILNLTDNRIGSLAGVVFPNRLRILNLSGNRLPSILSLVSGVILPTSLVSLNVSGNQMSSSCEAVNRLVTGFDSAQTIAQHAEWPPDTVSAVEAHLRPELLPDMARAIMHRVYEPIARLVSLKEFDLSHNRLTCLGGIEFPTSLEKLQLEGNQLTCLAGVRFPISLKTLDLEGNQITSLAGVTLPLSLTVLDTTGNPIVHVNNFVMPMVCQWIGMEQMSSLEGLTLNHDEIKENGKRVRLLKLFQAEPGAAQGGKRKKQHKQMKQTKKNNKKYRRKTKKNGIKNERRKRKKVKS